MLSALCTTSTGLHQTAISDWTSRPAGRQGPPERSTVPRRARHTRGRSEPPRLPHEKNRPGLCRELQAAEARLREAPLPARSPCPCPAPAPAAAGWPEPITSGRRSAHGLTPPESAPLSFSSALLASQHLILQQFFGIFPYSFTHHAP